MKKIKIKKLIRKEIKKIVPFIIEYIEESIIDNDNKNIEEKKVINKSNKTDTIKNVEDVVTNKMETIDLRPSNRHFENIKKEYPEIDEIRNNINQMFPGLETRFANYLAESVILNKNMIKRDELIEHEKLIKYENYYKKFWNMFSNNFFDEFEKVISFYNNIRNLEEDNLLQKDFPDKKNLSGDDMFHKKFFNEFEKLIIYYNKTNEEFRPKTKEELITKEDNTDLGNTGSTTNKIPQLINIEKKEN